MSAFTVPPTLTAEAIGEVMARPISKRRPATRVSRGGIDDINPDDIIYGEYSGDHNNLGNWLDLVYLDSDILRTFSGSVSTHHPVIEELKILLRPEDAFYLIPIKEVPQGFAFKRTDIVNIKVTSLIEGNSQHDPSCVWTMHFKDGKTRTLEISYQAYFSYGNTVRPASMSNATILDRVFADNKKE